MDKLSVIIITRNEENNIRDCLELVKWADEIVLIDQTSTDKTLEIARRYTDKIFITENKGSCDPDRMFAISKTSNEWILYIDADERISDDLRNEIISLLGSSEDKFDAYYMPRKTFFLGKWIKGCGWYGSLIRLFKKGKVVFSGKIHQDGQPLGSAGYLKGHILHYSYRDLTEYFEKFNRYTSIMAEEEYKKGLRVGKSNFLPLFLIRPAYVMLRKYFWQKGFKEGFAGFFISFSAALGIFVSYAKVWEKQRVGSEVQGK
ncbi:MAG: glycosyltransferase family 2 protein [Candidatus Omnitrophica bacterium]|nr:glycosyltransferase family 2 protein [Candidatus Omnitrophota bacterium]